uniref:Ras and Rab interactor 2 n=1 Tax=Denticeps clupeoides TaxID=299321 RepID=A0AAY4E5U7_9TELE
MSVREVSGLFLQSPECAETGGVRDSGYNSLRRRMSVLDRLMQTHPVWLQLSLSNEEARRILHSQSAGTFLVRRSCKLQKKVISLRMDGRCGAVLDFPIRESQYTFSLEGSGISFADLFRLVAFCCISRDVLPFTLKLPEAITAAKSLSDLGAVAQLGIGFWDSELCNKGKDSRLTTQDSAVPSVRTRSPFYLECGQSNGALCFINPLFLQTHRRGAPAAPPASSSRSPKQQSSARSPPPRPPPPRSRCVPHRPAPPRKQASMPETVCWINPPEEKTSLLKRLGSSFSSSPPKLISAPIAVPSRNRNSPNVSNVDNHSFKHSTEDERIEEAEALAMQALHNASLESGSPDLIPAKQGDVSAEGEGGAGEPARGRGERLSDLSFSSNSTDDSLDYSNSFSLSTATQPCAGGAQTGDSSMDDEDAEEEYSVSVESDQDIPLPHKSRKRHSRGTFVFPRALRGHLRKVSGVFNSLMTPEKRAIRRVVEQAQDKNTYFGSLVQDYISYMQEDRGQGHTSGSDMLQTLRQFITQMKAYLLQSSELDPPIESLIPEDQIDQVLEKALHKCVLKPLKGVVDSALQDFQVSGGAWQQLKENLALAKARQPQEMGVDGAVPPDPVAIEKIRHKFQNMAKLYSPDKKVTLLLRVCKLIYTIMEDNSGRMYGADDFLPMLTYVLAQCDMPQLDSEILYMMELLDPSLLHGEGGYYLTSAYGAMSLIKNFQEEQAARILSSETRNTLHQWHRRRTTQRTTPSVDDFQNYLRVALQEVDTGCTAKTLMVRPYATTEEVCQLCADKFKVADREKHALFLLTEGSSQQLAPDTYPQKIKAELHSRPQVQPFYFVYRRVDNTTSLFFKNGSLHATFA